MKPENNLFEVISACFGQMIVLNLSRIKMQLDLSCSAIYFRKLLY